LNKLPYFSHLVQLWVKTSRKHIVGRLYLQILFTLRHIAVAFDGILYPLGFAAFFVTWTELEVVHHLVEEMVLYHLHCLEELTVSIAQETRRY
jgi:hypothetical protein